LKGEEHFEGNDKETGEKTHFYRHDGQSRGDAIKEGQVIHDKKK
jgi:hypothetical protein